MYNKKSIVNNIISEAIRFESGTVFCIKDCPSFDLLKSSDRAWASRKFSSKMDEGWADEMYHGKTSFRKYTRN